MKNWQDSIGVHILSLYISAKEFFNRWVDTLLGFLILAALSVLVASAVLLFAIAWHQLTLVGNDIAKPSVLVSISKFILEFFVPVPPYNKPDEINAKLSILVGVLGAFATSFFSLAAGASTFYLRRKIRERATIQTFRVYREGVDDIKIMLREYARGSRVVIFGGDFSWVDRPSARDRIIQLANRRHIKFISYKCTSEIQSEIDKEMFGIISPMLSSEKSPEGLKASLIYNSDGNLLAYLYQTKSDDQERVHVCKVQGANPDGRRLLQQIQSFARNYSEVKPEQGSLRVILVCGKSKTGKTVFCKSMSSNNYPLVSVGDIVRGLYHAHNGSDPTSIELVEYGQQALIPGSELGAQLRAILLKEIDEATRPVVIDGLRVPWIFSEIMQTYRERAHFILFESSDEERIARISTTYESEPDDKLINALDALDRNVELLEKLATPTYKGKGGDTAFTSFGLQTYKNSADKH